VLFRTGEYSAEFIAVNREEIIRRCKAKVAPRSVPPPTGVEIDHGVPVFLDQLMDALRLGLTSSPEMVEAQSSTGVICCFKGSRSHRSYTIMATYVGPSPNWQWKRTRRSAPMTFAH
jgi:hypothetical protein